MLPSLGEPLSLQMHASLPMYGTLVDWVRPVREQRQGVHEHHIVPVNEIGVSAYRHQSQPSTPQLWPGWLGTGTPHLRYAAPSHPCSQHQTLFDQL